jgi:hypothetical protein
MASKTPMEAAEEEEKTVWFKESGKDGANEYATFLSFDHNVLEELARKELQVLRT